MKAEINGFTLNYEDIGSGIPVLCLPAFPFDHLMYSEQQALADVARLIMPDYRGSGGSSLTEGPYTMDLLADDMLALLDRLGIDRAVVFGVSMGNYVAFSMYDVAPERFYGLIIADTRAEADTPAQADRRRRTVEGLRAEGTSVLKDRVNDLFGASTRINHPRLVELMQQQTAGANPEGLAQLTLGMAMRHDRTDLLPKITVPTVVICGEEDTVSPPEGMRAMAAAIPGARYVPIPGAGHLSPLEHPGAVNRVIREFLAALPGE